MTIFEQLKDKDLMLINILYHYPRKVNNYNDYLDIIYKNNKTGKKHVTTIENPKMDIYFAKERGTVDYNRNFIHLKDAEKHTCDYKNILFYIAKEAGPSYMKWMNECAKTNRGKMKNIHKYKDVFGSDYDIESWYRIQWFLNNNNGSKNKLTKMYLDIEVDSINVPGFPKSGECPVNAVGIMDQETMTMHVFLLRNDKNPQIEEFENNIESFLEELSVDFDEVYGKIDYRFYMYDEEKELNLITDLFKLINTLKRDFLLIWNISFDIPFLIERIKNLNDDPVDIMCHKDFKIRDYSFKFDTKNFNVQNKTDVFKLSSYTVFMDQMELYGGMRKGGGEIRSFRLNAVAEHEIGDEKLNYSEEANIKTLAYVNYKKFVKYLIKDVLLQFGIELKTSDVDAAYQRAYVNVTPYEKIFRQTVFLKNRAYVEYYKQGLMIGNNINIDYGNYVEEEEEKEKFEGALVADPKLNSHMGVKIGGIPSKYIFNNVVDMDFSSMYPYIIITFNIAPNTLIGKLIINDTIQGVYNNALDEFDKKIDLGKDFIDNYMTDNLGMLGKKWFNLPGIEELTDKLEKEFNIKKKRVVNISENSVKQFYPIQLDIDLEEVVI